MIKNKNRGGLIDHKRKGVGVGEEENRRLEATETYFSQEKLITIH